MTGRIAKRWWTPALHCTCAPSHTYSVAACYKATVNQSVYRLLIVCFLLAALPFKGWAATGMIACGPNHHLVSGFTQVTHSDDSEQHRHSNGTHHRHSSDPNFQQDSEPAHSSLDNLNVGYGEDSYSQADSKCGTCAPCCAGVAIAIVNCSIQIAPASRMADFPAFVSEHSSAPLGRLERPPRTRLG